MTTDPTTLRTALGLSVFTLAGFAQHRPWCPEADGPADCTCGLYGVLDAIQCVCGHKVSVHTTRQVGDAVGWPCGGCKSDRCTGFAIAIAALATPALAADKARCAVCGRADGSVLHDPTDQDHPFTPPATEPVAALVEAFVNDEMMERLALALGGAASSMTEGEFTARLDAIVAAARAEVGLAEDRDRWKAEAEHQYALRASSGTLDGAWAEVERLLPEGWWMGGVQRYGGTWAAAVWGPAPAWDMARADGSTPVEALRNLAQALAARARRAGEAADDR